MNYQNRGYMNNVDELIEQTPLDVVLAHYGLPLSSGGEREYRMSCVFNELCGESQYGNLSIKLDAAKRIYCHSCSVRGNLLTLIHGLETRQPPTGGRLRGQEFKAAVSKLKQINGLASGGDLSKAVSRSETKPDSPQREDDSNKQTGERAANSTANPDTEEPATPLLVNVPLKRHEKQAARELENLCEELVVDVCEMSPDAAAYVRKRPWMTPELMRKWGCGWIPGNGRSLFRKNYFVYTHRNVRGDVVSYSGRDLSYERKWEKWLQDGKPEGKKPNKHRYVSGFHRGAELYGGIASRLKEDYIKESLSRYGLVIVEGMNDVIRMDELGVAAVGICSNKATDQQISMIVRFAHQVADRRALLLPDCDEQGEEGFKEALWQLGEYSINTRLGASREIMRRLGFSKTQPEDFTSNEWQRVSHRV